MGKSQARTSYACSDEFNLEGKEQLQMEPMGFH